jgi:AraC-like DNA-binding protein
MGAIMQASYEKTVLEPDFPFRLFLNEGYTSTPHHFHEDIEIIYLVEGRVKVGISNDIYNLNLGDILFIGSGAVHCFFEERELSTRAVIQFRMSIYDTFLYGDEDTKTIRPAFNKSMHLTPGTEIHKLMEKQIKELIKEHSEAKEGYKLFLKGRLYDLAGILLRYLPKGEYSKELDNNQMEKLKRLSKVFQYVEENYENSIDLDEISKVAGFSKYHFSRYFKENAGVTFLEYLNNFRITKAEWFLYYDKGSISEVAYKSGFNSVKTFNRVFKSLKGCAPMEYRKSI